MLIFSATFHIQDRCEQGRQTNTKEMNNNEYDKISLAYQFLTNRFDVRQNYHYSNYYRCYDSNYYGVKGDRLETLKCFENLTLRDIYKKEHIESNYYGEEYLDSKLVVVKENQVCILSELGQVFLYLLVSQLEIGIKQFQALLLELNKEHKGFFRLEDDGKKMVVDVNMFENEFKNQFEQIENYKYIIHLFGKTNSGFIMLNWNNYLEIHLNKINELLNSLDVFDFSKIDL